MNLEDLFVLTILAASAVLLAEVVFIVIIAVIMRVRSNGGLAKCLQAFGEFIYSLTRTSDS